MKMVLCPLGHRNEADARFCAQCKLPIPPDPTRVEPEPENDPEPIPVHELPEEPEPEPDEPVVEPPDEPEPEPEPERLPDGTICPNGHWNPPDQQRWCSECGEPLFVEPEPEPEPEKPFPWMLVGGGALAVLLVVGLVLVIGAIRGDDEPVIGSTTTPTTTPTTTTTAPPEPVPLAASAITVSASSEQPDGENYAVNAIDGAPDTAWGHCGAGCDPGDDADADDAGIGAYIQFDFDEPRIVVSFSIINGYDKVVEDGSDRWVQNSRIRTMTVTADGGQAETIDLRDVRTVQEFELGFSQPTSMVRFTVDDVYPGDRWVDVTISEVSFMVLAAGGEAPTGDGGSTDAVAQGSGCSPGTPDTLPDGQWFGFATAWSGTDVDFDLGCFYIDPDASVVAAERGTDAPGGFFIVNDNERVRTIPVSSSEIRAVRLVAADSGSIEGQATVFSDWAADQGYYSTVCPGASCPIWITVESGSITAIEHQYLP